MQPPAHLDVAPALSATPANVAASCVEAGLGGLLWTLAVAVMTAGFLVHVLTYLLWLYEGRVHGKAAAPRPVLPTFVSWLGEGLALMVALASWPFGWLSAAQVRSGRSGRPVVLIHDWGLNRASMALMAARLRRDGRDAYCMDYASVRGDLDAKAGQVAEGLRRIAGDTGAEKLDVVAHGQAGVVVRAAARYCDALGVLGNLVTLGAPHRGTALAAFVRAGGLMQLRPGARYLERLAEDDPIPTSVNVAVIHSTFDAVVFPDDCAYYPGAFSIAIDDVGHVGMLVSERVYVLVRENLEIALRRPEPGDRVMA